MDEAAYDVITAFTHATELTNRKLEPNEGGKIDMCEGIKQLIEEGKNEGISIGRNEGRNDKMKDLIPVYDPTHPDANEEGYYYMPNVDVLNEMVDLMVASRSYQANVTAMNASKSMYMKALEIGR